MNPGSSSFSDPAWDEQMIHELLGSDQAKLYVLKPLCNDQKPVLEIDSQSDSTNISETLPVSPQPKKRKGHRKVALKEKGIKGTNSAALKVSLQTSPPALNPPCPSPRDLSCLDQRQTIETIEEVIQQHDVDMGSWETQEPPSVQKKPDYDAYSLQQKREILAQLQGRISSIEGSIAAARTALERLIQFM